MHVGWVKIGDFRQIASYISKTIKVEQEVVCALSNGGIAHDLECPQITPFSAFCTTIHSFVTGEHRDFKFGTLTYHSKSHPADELYFLKGAWSWSGEPFQNITPRVISPQRLTLETSNFVHGTAMQCLSLVMSECFLSGSGSREQFLHCGLRKFRHSKSSVYR